MPRTVMSTTTKRNLINGVYVSAICVMLGWLTMTIKKKSVPTEMNVKAKIEEPVNVNGQVGVGGEVKISSVGGTVNTHVDGIDGVVEVCNKPCDVVEPNPKPKPKPKPKPELKPEPEPIVEKHCTVTITYRTPCNGR